MHPCSYGILENERKSYLAVQVVPAGSTITAVIITAQSFELGRQCFKRKDGYLRSDPTRIGRILPSLRGSVDTSATTTTLVQEGDCRTERLFVLAARREKGSNVHF